MEFELLYPLKVLFAMSSDVYYCHTCIRSLLGHCRVVVGVLLKKPVNLQQSGNKSPRRCIVQLLIYV